MLGWVVRSRGRLRRVIGWVGQKRSFSALRNYAMNPNELNKILQCPVQIVQRVALFVAIYEQHGTSNE